MRLREAESDGIIAIREEGEIYCIEGLGSEIGDINRLMEIIRELCIYYKAVSNFI